MQDADSQLVKLILTLEMLISVKYFSYFKMSFKKYIFGKSFGPWCPYPYARIRMETGGATRSEQPHDLREPLT